MGDQKSRRGVIRIAGEDLPPTAIANDGKTKLRRYEVRGVIYAPNKRVARERLREDLYLDAAEIR